MKKLAWLAAGLLATPWALAQSSVELYGSIDVGVDYLSNAGGGSLFAVNSGRRSPDRFGFRGKEDLGGGLSAVFRLEAGFNGDTGTNTSPVAFFNRYAFVGLEGRSWGSLVLGKMYDYPYEYLIGTSNAQPGLSSSFNVGVLDFPGGNIDNAIRYNSPNWNGFEFGVMNGFGEVPGQSQTNHRYSAGARYIRDGLTVAAAYSRYNNRAVDVRGLFGFTSFLGQTIGPGQQFAASRFTTTGVGAAYRFGKFVPHVMLTNVKLENATGSDTLHNYQAGVNIDLPWAGRTILGISAARYEIQNIAQNQANLFLTHYLSSRTQVYTGFSHANAMGPNATAGVTGYTKSSDRSQNFFRVGVNQFF